jgi:hypothetical protein
MNNGVLRASGAGECRETVHADRRANPKTIGLRGNTAEGETRRCSRSAVCDPSADWCKDGPRHTLQTAGKQSRHPTFRSEIFSLLFIGPATPLSK